MGHYLEELLIMAQRKRIRLFSVLVSLGLVLSACGTSTTPSAPASAQPAGSAAPASAQPAGSSAPASTAPGIGVSNISIAWIGKTLNNPWWVSVADFSAAEAKALGVNLTIALPQEEVDLEKQVAMIDAAIEKKVSAIIISASSSDGVIPEIQKARAAGIKIINFDTRISDKTLVDAYVGANDEAGAYKAGKYICKKLNGQGEVGLLEGLLAQSTGVDRKAGFERAIAECPGIKIVARTGAEWRSDLALNATQNMLTANPNIKAIFASNDQMAVGMVAGVKAAGKNPKDYILVGYDGILDAVNAVLAGDLSAFVALPNREEATMGVRLATAIVLNPTYKYSRELIFPGPLVTATFDEGSTDETIDEYAARQFPLRGVTQKGY
jgi:ABC-type sugar transport system substrate-binding protein